MLDEFLLYSLITVLTVIHSVLFHPVFNQAIFTSLSKFSSRLFSPGWLPCSYPSMDLHKLCSVVPVLSTTLFHALSNCIVFLIYDSFLFIRQLLEGQHYICLILISYSINSYQTEKWTKFSRQHLYHCNLLLFTAIFKVSSFIEYSCVGIFHFPQHSWK